MSSDRPNASYSNVRLTRRNHTGGHLLRTIRDHTNSSGTVQVTQPLGQDSEVMDEADIYAQPLSSDEDEQHVVEHQTQSSPRGNGKRSLEQIAEPSRCSKRVKTAIKTTRSSNRKTLNLEPEVVLTSSASIPEFLDYASQSSQSRKRNIKYGKTNSYTRSSQEDGFTIPGDIPTTPRKPQGALFRPPERTPSTRNKTPKQKVKDIEVPPSSTKLQEKFIEFKIPEDVGLPKSTSTSTDLSIIFDVDDLADVQCRKRSSSTSSLSSIDSMASLELTQEQKNHLENDVASQTPIPTDCTRCPLCHHIVKLPTNSPQSNPTNLSLRKQQIFCTQHRLRDADTEWKQKGYPTIDWDILEKTRIPDHIPQLRQVLYRKHPSFYLDHLESKLKEARGNQSKIRSYLATDIVEVVKPGYYGPKGAKVMGNRITTDMANHLKRSLKTDKTVRAVGVSGFVSAVLLPELLLRVVMEDMDITDEDEARELVSRSTEAGMLIWPDDDHVVPDGETSDV